MKNSEYQKQADIDSKADKRRIKELERELARKEKVLADGGSYLASESS